MTSSQTSNVAYFDLSDPAFSVRSSAVHDAREQNWYAKTNYGIAVLRYEDVKALLKDRRLRQGLFAWPGQNGITGGLLVEWWAEMVGNKEGADHQRLRKLVYPIFTPRIIQEMAPRFRSIATELIDQFAGDGRCEFVSAFSTPYAAKVLIDLLGMRESDWQRVSEWSSTISLALGVTIAQDRDRIEAALAELYAYTDELIDERRKHPGADAISRLVHAHDTEDQLTDTELRTMVSVLIFAGMDTTRNQLALAVHTFAEHPDQWSLLAERPELAAAAVEEVMRVSPTILWITRETTEDIVIRGVHIEAGTTLHLLPESANTDPFADMDGAFDITAERPQLHVGFGAGLHHCLGHFFARTDMREALPLLAQRMPDVQVDGEPDYRPQSGMTGPNSLPLTFQATVT